jgi:hypothetical protein
MAPRMWRWGTQAVSPGSVLMVNIVSTPPQRPLRASLTVSVAILMVGTPGESQGFSRLVFDLLPNPSIDHLVSVILKCPRREESDWRKSLNPGSTG